MCALLLCHKTLENLISLQAPGTYNCTILTYYLTSFLYITMYNITACIVLVKVSCFVTGHSTVWEYSHHIYHLTCCQAQTKPQLQLSWAALALISAKI